MSNTVHINDLLASLSKDVDIVAGLAYKAPKTIYESCSEQKSLDKNFAIIVMNRTLGYATERQEGDNFIYQKPEQLFLYTAYVRHYEVNERITGEALYYLSDKEIVRKVITGTAERARSMKLKQDKSFNDMINDYDNATQTFGDGKTLGAIDHLTGDGSTFSNIASSAASPTELTLEAILNQISKWKDTGGKYVDIQATKVIGGIERRFEFERMLETERDLDTNVNNRNIINLKRGKYLPQGFEVDPHFGLSSTDLSWAVLTNVPDGFMTFNSMPAEFGMYPISESYDKAFTARAGWVHTVGDYRCVYISPRA